MAHFRPSLRMIIVRRCILDIAQQQIRSLPASSLHDCERVKPGDHRVVGSSTNPHGVPREHVSELRIQSSSASGELYNPPDRGQIEQALGMLSPVNGLELRPSFETAFTQPSAKQLTVSRREQGDAPIGRLVVRCHEVFTRAEALKVVATLPSARRARMNANRNARTTPYARALIVSAMPQVSGSLRMRQALGSRCARSTSGWCVSLWRTEGAGDTLKRTGLSCQKDHGVVASRRHPPARRLSHDSCPDRGAAGTGPLSTVARWLKRTGLGGHKALEPRPPVVRSVTASSPIWTPSR